MRGLGSSPQQRHPFSALALHQGRSQVDIAEDFCVKIAGSVVTINSEILGEVPATRFPELNVSFSLEELDAALATCRRSSSPGPDGITYAALCHLGEDGRSRLLECYNQSWNDGVVPERWKSSRLIPLLKPGKSPLDLASYRPLRCPAVLGRSWKE